MSQDLIKSVSIDALLARRDSYLEKMEAGLTLMREAGAIGTDLSIGRPAIDIEPFERAATTSVFDPGAIELLRSMADANAWHYLLRESGLYTFMDRKSRGEWKKMIDRRDVPPLTRDNIEASFSSLYESRQVFPFLELELQDQLPVAVRQARHPVVVCPIRSRVRLLLLPG